MADRLDEASAETARSKCRVAIVGAGYMSREHIRAFQDIPGAEITGIHSRTRPRADALANEFGFQNVCDSIPELFEKSAADLVVISVPELSTNEVCRACFEHPWAALIEKPAGYNVGDAEAIESVARQRNRRAYVALNRRHYGSTRTMLADIANQEGPRLIKVQDQEGALAALQAGQPRIVVENWMYANSIHVIDYFSFLGRGKITEVNPVIRWDPKHPRYVAATIRFDSGDVGLYEAIWDGPGPWAVTVNTPGKRWELRPLETASYQLAGTRVLKQVEADPWDAKFKPGLRMQAEQAVMAVSGLRNELPTLQDALVSMRLTQSIYA